MIPTINLDAGEGANWLHRGRAGSDMRIAELYIRGGHLLETISVAGLSGEKIQILFREPDGTVRETRIVEDADDAIAAVAGYLRRMVKERGARAEIRAGTYERRLLKALREGG